MRHREEHRKQGVWHGTLIEHEGVRWRPVWRLMGKQHPGFAAVQGQIARRQGISKGRAGAILAAGTRKAGPAAKKKNPRLKKVKGG